MYVAVKSVWAAKVGVALTANAATTSRTVTRRLKCRIKSAHSRTPDATRARKFLAVSVKNRRTARMAAVNTT